MLLSEPADVHKGLALETTTRIINQRLDENGSNITEVVHNACDATGLKQKIFMTVNRHALSAMKVCFARALLMDADSPKVWTKYCRHHWCPWPRAHDFETQSGAFYNT